MPADAFQTKISKILLLIINYVFVCIAIYESLSQYPMKSNPRGRCLIINMSTFDKGEVPLNPRAGADKDIGQFCVFLSLAL